MCPRGYSGGLIGNRSVFKGAADMRLCPEELVSALQAVIDFPFWRALIQAGVAEDVAPGLMLDLCRALLTRYGLVVEVDRSAGFRLRPKHRGSRN